MTKKHSEMGGTQQIFDEDPDFAVILETENLRAYALAVRMLILSAQTEDELKEIGTAIAKDVEEGEEWTQNPHRLNYARERWQARMTEIQNENTTSSQGKEKKQGEKSTDS